ncbi:MAG TPA: hypothetical protein VG122_02295 [Gemmata sp.]|jgi:hypothetical protein|nr:hypothetical protein [Gemmata sp.]
MKDTLAKLLQAFSALASEPDAQVGASFNEVYRTSTKEIMP